MPTDEPKPKRRNALQKTPVTSHDVARAAGVSQSVVSRAFNPNGKIAAATRTKVLAVARELGYYPNAFARTLVQQRTKIVGVMMARIDNHFYPKVLEDLTTQLWQVDRQVMYFGVDDGRADTLDTLTDASASRGQDLSRVLQMALQYRVEAMVVASITLSSRTAEIFSDAGIPVILFNRSLDTAPSSAEVYAVSCDNFYGGTLVADAFLDARHECYAFIGGSPDTSTNRDRKAGFMDALKGRGAGLAYAVEKEYSYEWGRNASRYLLEQQSPPDAIFCASDLIALGALDCARAEFALRVPEDVAITGFDDIAAAGWLGYQLTTVRQPVDLMLKETLAIITGERRAKQLTLPVTLVRRASTRPNALAGGARAEEVTP